MRTEEQTSEGRRHVWLPGQPVSSHPDQEQMEGTFTASGAQTDSITHLITSQLKDQFARSLPEAGRPGTAAPVFLGDKQEAISSGSSQKTVLVK